MEVIYIYHASNIRIIENKNGPLSLILQVQFSTPWYTRPIYQINTTNTKK